MPAAPAAVIVLGLIPGTPAWKARHETKKKAKKKGRQK